MMSFRAKSILENLYAILPIAMQNAVFSLYGAKIYYQRYGRHFHHKLAALKQSEWWSAERIHEFQNQQLRNCIQDAYLNVPYYRKLFESLNLRPEDIRSVHDLQQLPLLTKKVVREQSKKLINQSIPRHNLAKHLTSGTTGTPLEVLLTKEALQFQWAVWWRHRARFGLHLGDKFLMFGARLPVAIKQQKPPVWRHNAAINQTYLSTYHLAPSLIPDIVNWLNRESFDFYTGYPSAMYALCTFMKEHGLRLLNRPKYIVTGSDALLPGFKATIEEVFGVGVTEQYGMAEACGNLAKCECGRFHVDFEFGILELLPIPGLEDTKIRKMVFTGLANPAMPLIRYDIGDYAEISETPCPCGRASLTVERIDGRTEDFIYTPDGRLISGMNQVFEWAPGVKETQVVQDTLAQIEVRVVPDITFNASRDLTILEIELRKRLGHEMQIKFALVDTIPRTKNGKFRAVISNLSSLHNKGFELQAAVQHGVLPADKKPV